MASISANGSRGHHRFTLNVNETGTSTANNTSTVSYSFVLSPVQTGWDWNISGVSYKITINGTSFTGTIPSYNGSSTVTLKSGSMTIGHNTDGSKNIGFSFSVTDNAGKTYTPGSCSSSGNMNLTKILRQATITSAPDFNDEGNPTIKYNNPLGNNATSLEACISLTGATDDIKYRAISKTDGTYTFNLTQEERNLLLNASKTSNSISIRFYVRTGIGTGKYLNYVTRTMSIVNATPIFDDFDYEDRNDITVGITGDNKILINGYSDVEITIPSENKMEALKNATPIKYVSTLGTLSQTTEYSEDDLTAILGIPTISGISSLGVRAYDSRNNSTLVSKEVNIYDYSIPTINCTANRIGDFEDETIIKVDGLFTELKINDVAKNTIQNVQYRYKKSTEQTWNEWANIQYSIENDKYICNDVIVSLNKEFSYNIQIQVSDKLGTRIAELSVDEGIPVFIISSNKKECYINNKKVLTEGEEYLIDYSVDNDTTRVISFDLDLEEYQGLEIKISGSVASASNTDVLMTINDKSSGYYQMGYVFSGTATSDGNLTQSAVSRFNKSSFYWYHGLGPYMTIIEGKITFEIDPKQNKFIPNYTWKNKKMLSGMQAYAQVYGWLDTQDTQINKLSFEVQNTYFSKGTIIKIKKI